MTISDETANFFVDNFNINSGRYILSQEMLNNLEIKITNFNKDLHLYHIVEDFRCKLILPKVNKIVLLDGSELTSRSRYFLNVRFLRDTRFFLTLEQRRRMMRLLNQKLEEP